MLVPGEVGDYTKFIEYPKAFRALGRPWTLAYWGSFSAASLRSDITTHDFAPPTFDLLPTPLLWVERWRYIHIFFS